MNDEDKIRLAEELLQGTGYKVVEDTDDPSYKAGQAMAQAFMKAQRQ